MHKKRIIAVVSMNSPGRNGVGSSRWNLAYLLSRVGHEVHFITEFQHSIQADTSSSAPIDVIPLRPHLSARSLMWSIGKRIHNNIFSDVSPTDIDVVKFASAVSSNLPAYVEKYKIDTVFFSESFMEFLYFLPSKTCRTFISFQCPRYLFQDIGLSNAPVNRYLRQKESELVPLADRFFTPSHAMSVLASKYYGINANRISVIPNCIDTDVFYPLAEKKNSGTVSICFVGRFSREKGAELVIDIIPELMKAYPNLHFSLAGDSAPLQDARTYIDILRDRIEKYNLTGRFIWDRYIPPSDLADFYRRHDIFISPTLFESFGMTIAEAQACGLPVVVTDAGGTSETLKDNLSGFLIHPGDTKSFSEKLETLIKDNRLRTLMGHEGRSFAIDNFSFEVLSDKIKDLIE